MREGNGSPHQLLLLSVTLLPLCQANVYYVSPTTSPQLARDSVPCPTTGEPCFSLNYYSSRHYFSSDSVFRFLPGTHTIEQPLTISYLTNVTLEAAVLGGPQPIVEVESIHCLNNDLTPVGDGDFLAVPRCSSISFKRCNDLVVKGLRLQSAIRWEFNFTGYFQLVTGDISFEHAENVYVEDVSARRGLIYMSGHTVNITRSTFGNLELHCNQSQNTTHGSLYGLFIANTDYISLNNVTVINAQHYGMYLFNTREAVLDGIASLNALFGSALVLHLAHETKVHSPVLRICWDGLTVMEVRTSINAVIEGVNMATDPGRIKVVNSININFVSLSFASEVEGQSTNSAVFIYTCTNVSFQNSSFNDSAPPKELTTDVVSLPPVIYAYFSKGIEFRDSTFARNKKTGIKARASGIIFSGKVKFLDNSAPSGAGIIIAKQSNITLNEDSSVLFDGNRAASSGGAIYIVSGEDVPEQLSDRWCFLHVRGTRSRSHMTFRDNWAGKAGDVLYGGHLSIGYNGIEENCLQNFWNASDISQQKSLSVVSSESSRVCLCDTETGVPDCLRIHSEPQAVYPGQTLSLSAVIVGQAFGSVTGSVFAHFIQDSPNDIAPQLLSSQYTQVVSKDSCNLLNYTIFKTAENGSTEAILTLTPQFRETSLYLSNRSDTVRDALHKYKDWSEMDPLYTPFPKNILEFPVYVNITLLPCPLGFFLRGSPTAKCECDQVLLDLSGVDCDITNQTIARSGSVWIGVGDRGNSTEGLMTSSYCPLNYCKSERIRLKEGEYDTQCNYRHSGVLCGGCRNNLSLALGSSQCLSCSNRYLVLILPFLLAGVALVAFIKLINLTIAQGTLNGVLFYVNIVKANEFIFLPEAGTNPLTLFIAWSNLDLGIETCFLDGLTAYSKAWLQFVFPVYIWAIAGGIVVLSKYSSRVAGLMGSNSVSVLATLFLLSYSKLLRIIIVGVSYTVLETSSGQKIVWSSDGNLDYLGSQHAPMFAACLAALVFLWLPYTLLLFCGQWLYKLKCRSVVKLLGRLTPFLDAHYAPLEGRHRYWFGAQLLIRAAILIASYTIPANSSSIVVFSVSVAAVVLTAVSSIGFYRNKQVSLFEITFFANLCLLGISTFFTASGGQTATPAYVLIMVAFLQFLGLVSYKISERFRLTSLMLACCNSRGKYFHTMKEDEWEMVEREAQRREEELNRDSTSRIEQNSSSKDVRESSCRTY